MQEQKLKVKEREYSGRHVLNALPERSTSSVFMVKMIWMLTISSVIGGGEVVHVGDAPVVSVARCAAVLFGSTSRH